MSDTIVVNLFGGPGTGKSTAMADVFAKLKRAGYNVEQAPEWVKKVVWERRTKPLENQVYILGKQYFEIRRLLDEVDVIITDSPIILSLLYKTPDLTANFDGLVMDLFNSFNNLNFFLQRKKAYNPKGRLQTEDEAKEIDKTNYALLKDQGIPFYTVPGNEEGCERIFNFIAKRLERQVS